MFALISILGPSVIGLKVIDYLREGLTIKNATFYYVILVLLSSTINNVASYLIWGLYDNIIIHLNTLPVFFAKYVLLSIAINVLLALFFVIIIKNVSFNIELEKEKSSEKKNLKRSKIRKKNNNK